jgi:predicted MFS family arabinose efflux permease
MPIAAGRAPMATAAGWRTNLRSATLRRCFALGFCILFAFIGTFTYVNFALIGPPYLLSPMLLGSVYLVFVPAMVTTPLAGRVVGRFGPAVTLLGGLVVALVGLPLLLLPTLPALLAGLILVAAGTFMAQAVATGIVARSAVGDSGSATGIYLASYFTGGLVGSAALGAVFTAYGWQGCVAGIGLALLVALWLGWGLRENLPQRRAD